MPIRAHRFSILLLALAACGSPAPPLEPPPAPPPTAPPPVPPPVAPARPPGLRADLDASWLGPDGQLREPPNDGFDAAPVYSTLQPDRLIDQFGGSGRVFSPKGALFAQRALPTVCTAERYTVYRVLQPLPVASGKAAPWFDQPGGATRYETEQASDALVAAHLIEPVPDPGPPPCDTP